MAILQGRLKPQDVIDPNRPIQPVQAAPAPKPTEVRRYMCPKCGGKMAFDPKQRALACEHCGHTMHEYQAIMSGALVTEVQEHDFFATLPTAQAHRWQLPTERTLTCKGCGAVFVWLSSQVSGACPYCESPHVIESAEQKELIQPESVLPFQFDSDKALQIARQWLKKQSFRPDDLDKKSAMARPRGVYVPFWTFDIGGEIKWHAVLEEDRNVIHRDDIYLVDHDDLLIPGTRSLPPDALNKLADFDTHALVPYSADLLADWPTEIYQLPLADASLLARQRVFEAAKKRIREYTLGDQNVRDLNCNSLGIIINTYKLALLPVYVTGYRYKGTYFPLGINGQTGTAGGNVPRGKAHKLLAWVFGED
jgi:DNA-directed RNA polymerase subunit RPC12/RpoP